MMKIVSCFGITQEYSYSIFQDLWNNDVLNLPERVGKNENIILLSEQIDKLWYLDRIFVG